MNTECTCYAIGVIIDGIASGNGHTGRGARYNSAITYINDSVLIETRDEKLCAIVISEDGDIDLIIQGIIENEVKGGAL